MSWDLEISCFCGHNGVFQECRDLCQEIVIMGFYLHIPGCSLHVHQDQGHIVLRGNVSDARVHSECPNIIDDGGARFYWPFSATIALVVSMEMGSRVLRCHRFDHRYNPLYFVFHSYGF